MDVQQEQEKLRKQASEYLRRLDEIRRSPRKNKGGREIEVLDGDERAFLYTMEERVANCAMIRSGQVQIMDAITERLSSEGWL